MTLISTSAGKLVKSRGDGCIQSIVSRGMMVASTSRAVPYMAATPGGRGNGDMSVENCNLLHNRVKFFENRVSG
jgi:hypothetical protein